MLTVSRSSYPAVCNSTASNEDEETPLNKVYYYYSDFSPTKAKYTAAVYPITKTNILKQKLSDYMYNDPKF